MTDDVFELRRALAICVGVLDDQPRECRYHGADFGRMGWFAGEPRCDSCKTPFRIAQARAAADMALAATAPKPPTTTGDPR